MSISDKIDAISDRLESMGFMKEALWLDTVANTIDREFQDDEEMRKVIDDLYRGIAPYGIKIKDENIEKTPNKTVKIDLKFEAHTIAKEDLKSFLDIALPSDGSIEVSGIFFDFTKEGIPQISVDALKSFITRQVPKSLRIKGVSIEGHQPSMVALVDLESNKVDYRDLSVLLNSKYLKSVVVTGLSVEIPIKETVSRKNLMQ